jgi:hypothetical protein
MSSSRNSFDLVRYRAFVVAGLFLGLGLLAFEVAGSNAFGWSPKVLWTGKVPNEWYDWYNNGRLVAGGQQARRQASGRAFALMVGASTTHYSMTADALDRCDAMDLDWIVITSTRMSFTVMEENVFEPLRMSPELSAPKLLAMGIHPEMLVGASERTPTFAEAWAKVTGSLERRRWKEAAAALGRSSFIIHIRGRIANALETKLSRARFAMMRRFGQDLSTTFHPPIHPRVSRIPSAGNTRSFLPDTAIGQHLQAWKAAGFADASNYSSRSAQADALRRILNEYPGVPVVFVIMPARSEFRVGQAMREIRAVWDELFREFARTRSVSVADLSGHLNNQAFKDVGHANLVGRGLLQRLVPRAMSLASDVEPEERTECETSGSAPVVVEQIRSP